MVALITGTVGARLDQLGWSGEETTLLDALSCHSLRSFKSAILAPQQAKDKQMKNLTTPQAILCGFALIALAIASLPYSSNLVSPAQAYTDRVSKVAICSKDGARCANVFTASYDISGVEGTVTYLSTNQIMPQKPLPKSKY